MGQSGVQLRDVTVLDSAESECGNYKVIAVGQSWFFLSLVVKIKHSLLTPGGQCFCSPVALVSTLTCFSVSDGFIYLGILSASPSGV